MIFPIGSGVLVADDGLAQFLAPQTFVRSTVLGWPVYGFVLFAVIGPHGNPFGNGLFIKKSGNFGAFGEPSIEFPFVAFWLRAARSDPKVVIAPEMRPIVGFLNE